MARGGEQLISFAVWYLDSAKLRDSFNLTQVKLPISPGALLAKEFREFSRSVSELRHK